MKSTLTLLSFLVVVLAWSKPQVYFNYKTFYTPEGTPYVSTALQFIGGSFKYIGDGNGNLGAKVEIMQIFSKGDSIIIADKYILDSPPMADSIVDDFYDIQRYSLEPGIYDYELLITDVISGERVEGKQMMEVSALPEDALALSDIDFIEDAFPSTAQNNFTKSGFFLLPYLTNYFPPEINKIAFYSEIYNADEALGAGEPYMITCSVSEYISGNPIDGIFKFKRMEANAVNPVILYVPIDNLPSGDYNLDVNLINKNNDTLLRESTFFQRRNVIPDDINISLEDVEIDPTFRNDITRDSIPYFLGSLMPISERYEYETIRSILKQGDTTYMENYFFAFWKETDPLNPYLAWLKYKEQVYYAEKLFGTQIKTGYETDRGRIHLRYGAPNAVVDRPNEPSAYPYQIWHYYRIGQRSNIRFVFYNPDLVTNDYPLLHSDMQGELQNYRWQNDLHKRDSPTDDLDDPGGTDHYGGTSKALYNGGM